MDNQKLAFEFEDRIVIPFANEISNDDISKEELFNQIDVDELISILETDGIGYDQDEMEYELLADGYDSEDDTNYNIEDVAEYAVDHLLLQSVLTIPHELLDFF